MKRKELPGKKTGIGRRGFSLIELLIVIAILGILSVSVGVNMNTASTKLKTFVFNAKTRFRQAKYEAITRGRNVYLDFDFDKNNAVDSNGFTIWADDTGDGLYTAWAVATDDANGNGECDPGEGDCVIDTVSFVQAGGKSGPEIYCATCASGGPGDDGPGGSHIGDGVSAGGVVANRFMFKPNGDSSDGTVYFYFPQGPAGAKKVKAGPWAIIVNNVGRVSIDEWQSAGMGWAVNTAD